MQRKKGVADIEEMRDEKGDLSTDPEHAWGTLQFPRQGKMTKGIPVSIVNPSHLLHLLHDCRTTLDGKLLAASRKTKNANIPRKPYIEVKISGNSRVFTDSYW